MANCVCTFLTFSLSKRVQITVCFVFSKPMCLKCIKFLIHTRGSPLKFLVEQLYSLVKAELKTIRLIVTCFHRRNRYITKKKLLPERKKA